MKNKIFSRGLYVEGIRQLRVVGIILLSALLLIGIAPPVIQYINYLDYVARFPEEISLYTPEVVDFVELCPALFFIAITAPVIFTFMMYSAFNKRSSSDFYHSLPYTRICIFNSFTAAILTWVAALSIIYCAASTITCALMPQIFIINLTETVDILLTAIAISMMLVFGIIAAMSLTGTPIANITCAGLLLFLPRLLITLVTLVMGEIAPIIEGHYGFFGTEYNSLVNLVSQILFYGNDDFYLHNIASDIYSIVIALAYAILAAILFCRRNSETSGHAATGKRMHHFIRICVGFVVSSIVTCAAISELELPLVIVFYIVAIIIYFAYELITQKTFRTIPSTLPGLAILVGLNIAIAAACFGCTAYVHSYTPANEDVDAIYIENSNDNYFRHSITFKTYADEKAAQIKIEDRDAIAIAAENLRVNNERSKKGNFNSFMYEEKGDNYYYGDPEADLQYTHFSVVYVSNGIKRTRNIYMSIDDYTKMMGYVQSNDAYKTSFYEIPDAVDRTIEIFEKYDHNYIHMTEEEYEKILRSLQEEVKGLDFAEWTTYLASDNVNTSGFCIRYQPKDHESTLELTFDGTLFPETMAMIFEIANKKSENEIDLIYDILSDYEAAEKKYENIYFNISAVDEKTQWRLYHHWYLDENTKNSDFNKEFAEELKDLAEKSKVGKLESDKFLAVYCEFSTREKNPETDEYEYSSENAMVFLPYPEGFEPESENFTIMNYEYDEEYYKYYEDTIIVG